MRQKFHNFFISDFSTSTQIRKYMYVMYVFLRTFQNRIKSKFFAGKDFWLSCTIFVHRDIFNKNCTQERRRHNTKK